MPSEASEADAARFQVNEEQHVGGETSPGEHFDGEEVGAGQAGIEKDSSRGCIPRFQFNRLLVWDYDRLRHILPFRPTDADHHVIDKNNKFPAWFFMCVFAAAASVIVINYFLYDIRPGN